MGPCGQFIDRMAFQIEPFYQYQQATFPTGSWPAPGRKARVAVAGWREGECASRRHEYAIHVIRVIRDTASARRQEASLDLPVDPPRDGESKQAWVYRQIRERVLRARCRPARACRPRAAWRSAGASPGPRSRRPTTSCAAKATRPARSGRVHMWRPSFQITSSARDCQERAGRPWARMPGIRRARPRSPRPVSRPGGRRARCRMSSR